jgi:hypothetical protein
VEQQQESLETQPQQEQASPRSDDRADLLKALEDSVADIAESGEAKAKPEPKPAPEPELESAPEAEAETKAPPTTKRLAKILAEREQVRSAKLEAERMRAEAERARQEALQLQEQAKLERQRWEALKKDPINAFREIGLEPDEFVDRVIKEGTPEWKALTAQERQFEALKKELDDLKNFKAQQEQERKRWEQQAMEQRQQQAYSQFLTVASEEKCPTLRALYTDKEILRWGDEIADQYRAKTGQVAPFEEIAQYMEDISSERLQKVSAKPKAASKARTLTGRDTSERRAAPKPSHELSPTEERRMLLEEAEAVKRNYAKTQK